MQSIKDDVKTWTQVREVTAQGAVIVDVIDESSACHTGGCGASGSLSCQTNAFARLFARAPALTLTLTQADIAVGDQLLLSLSRSSLMRMSLLAYAFPLLCLLIGLAIGQFFGGDWGAFYVGISCLLFSWLLVGKTTVSITPTVIKIQRSIQEGKSVCLQ